MGLHRCAFFDRDGVINTRPAPGEYVRTWEEFHPVPAAAEWIRLFNDLDFRVIVVTNQRGVSRGLIDPAELERIHENMRREIARRGARIDDVYYCPHAEGVCECRKPKPGMVREAARKWDLDLAGSVMLGDSDSDRLLAETCGMSFIGVRDGRLLE